MKQTRTLCMALMFGVMIWATVPSAKADLALRLSDGTTTLVISDNCTVIAAGTCDATDSSGLAGVVTFNGAVGAWIVNVSTGIGDPLLGAPHPHMDLNSTDTTSAASTLTIEFSENGFDATRDAQILDMKIGGTNNGPAGSTATYTAYKDQTNALFGEAATVNTLGAFGNGAYSGTANGVVPTGTTPFSLTQKVVLAYTGAGNGSFNAELQGAPEPASIVFLGTILFGLSALIRRKVRAA